MEKEQLRESEDLDFDLSNAMHDQFGYDILGKHTVIAKANEEIRAKNKKAWWED